MHSSRPASCNLPSLETPLEGLEDALEELTELLQDEVAPVQLVTITGLPGIGEACNSTAICILLQAVVHAHEPHVKRATASLVLCYSLICRSSVQQLCKKQTWQQPS